MNYIRQTPTEECPLTKEKENCSISDCCGFWSIICSFIALTIIVTAALILQLVYDDNAFQGKLNIHGAVATDSTNCSQIGTKILRKGGNAIDAAIAATLCMTVVAPHKTGLGSGGYILIYSHKNREKPKVIDFLNNTISDEFKKNKIRIPALLRGLEYAHAKYGKLLWQDIVEPSVMLARKGFEVSRDLANEGTKNVNIGIFAHINAGEILTLPNLANTLETVSKFGISVFYNGTITKKIFSNKIMNKKLLDQLSSYEPQTIIAQKTLLSHYAIFYPPSFNFVKSIIEKINNLNIFKNNASSIESVITVAKAIINLTQQINNSFVDHAEFRRYTGVSAVDWQDTYVSVITGLSAPLNFEHETEAGFSFDNIEKENLLLSLIPIAFYDETAICGLRGVFSSDDSIIVGEILYNLLIRLMNLSAAIEYPRYYILKDGIIVENDERNSENRLLFNSLTDLDKISKINANMIMKSVNIIIKQKNLISGHSDSRGDGLASRF